MINIHMQFTYGIRKLIYKIFVKKISFDVRKMEWYWWAYDEQVEK